MQHRQYVSKNCVEEDLSAKIIHDKIHNVVRVLSSSLLLSVSTSISEESDLHSVHLMQALDSSQQLKEN